MVPAFCASGGPETRPPLAIAEWLRRPVSAAYRLPNTLRRVGSGMAAALPRPGPGEGKYDADCVRDTPQPPCLLLSTGRMHEPTKGQPDFAGEPTAWTHQESPRGPVPRSPEASEVDAKAAATTDLDRPMTIPEFARWIGVKQCWVRKRLRLLPGVIVESREVVRTHGGRASQ